MDFELFTGSVNVDILIYLICVKNHFNMNSSPSTSAECNRAEFFWILDDMMIEETFPVAKQQVSFKKN